MRIEITTGGEREYFSGTPTEIVIQMNQTAMLAEPDFRSYMVRFARFADLVQGARIETETPDAFIDSLIAAGIARTLT